jgi:hypothetical protein
MEPPITPTLEHVGHCAECGYRLERSSGPGRVRAYRGESGYELPEDLVFWACANCGAEWLNASQIDQLSDAFEKQREERRPPRTLWAVELPIGKGDWLIRDIFSHQWGADEQSTAYRDEPDGLCPRVVPVDDTFHVHDFDRRSDDECDAAIARSDAGRSGT